MDDVAPRTMSDEQGDGLWLPHIPPEYGRCRRAMLRRPRHAISAVGVRGDEAFERVHVAQPAEQALSTSRESATRSRPQAIAIHRQAAGKSEPPSSFVNGRGS